MPRPQSPLERYLNRYQLQDMEMDETQPSMPRDYSVFAEGFETLIKNRTPSNSGATELSAAELDVLRKASQLQYTRCEQYSDILHHLHLGNHESDFFQKYIRKQRDNFANLANTELVIPLQYISSSHRYLLKTKVGQENFHCEKCNRIVSTEYLFLQYNNIFCGEHVPDPDTFNRCFCCNRVEKGKIITTIDYHSLFACSDCLRSLCQRCGNPKDDNLVVEHLCKSCLDAPQEQNENGKRRYSNTLRWTVAKANGASIKSTRAFSAEIEVWVPSHISVGELSAEIPRDAGIGTDSSINSNGKGFEVQTPRLRGDVGEEFVKRTTSVLNKFGAKVNRSCGLHVHIDGMGLLLADRTQYPQALVDFWRAHMVFEDVIKSFIPYQRRNNDYARSLSQAFTFMELDTIQTLQQAEQVWYKETEYGHIRHAKDDRFHSSRYFGLNLHPLFSDYHFEIRYHSGTTQAHKILEWANLHSLIADAAVQNKLPRKFALEAAATSSVHEKTKMLFAAIGLAPKSQAYFFGRQNKFNDKSLDEDNLN